MHKGFKCLDISKGHIYISCDVLFDEYVFPFAELHSNAVLLLPTASTGNDVITNYDSFVCCFSFAERSSL
jgi:hypothetical protein